MAVPINFTDSQYKFDTVVNQVENGLSIVSMVPGLGFVSGGLKIVIGLIQTIAGGILTAAFKALGNDQYKEYANIHFKHGLSDMGIGLLEAIPIAGFVLGIIRIVNDGATMPHSEYTGVVIESAHRFKFKPYPSLQQRDVIFANCSAEEANRLQDEYQAYIRQNPNFPYSYSKAQIARNADMQAQIRRDLARTPQLPVKG